jgi:TolB-like protein/DNA-binding winged helix-turn-helix (wHTH) protein
MDEQRLAFGPFRLNDANGTLLRDGEPLPVGQRAVRVLKALLEHPGEVLTKSELMDAAWPDATVEEANLHVQIASLRKILGPAPDGGEWIATIPRVGYRFVPDREARDLAPIAPAGANDNKDIAPWWLPLRRPHAARWLAAVTGVIFLAMIVGFALLRPVEAPQAVAAGPNASIAVLPFDEMSGDPDLAYFGFGVSEDITAMLARVPNLTVVARNSAFQYRGQAVDVRRIGEELGATHVLEGSVRKDADRLRIVAQLIDARTGRHVWADRFDRTGTDPRALQDEVTQKIVSALAGNAGTLALQQYAEAWGKDHANLQEYDYLLRSLSRIALGTPESADMAEATLAEGLARFPNSSLLKAQAAATVMWRFGRGWSHSENPLEDIRRAGDMAREALSDPRGSPMLRLVLTLRSPTPIWRSADTTRPWRRPRRRWRWRPMTGAPSIIWPNR